MKPLETLEKLRKGEEVICELCNKGIMKAIGNTHYETTHCFKCDNCGSMINID